jgi:hypothetical protein
MNGQHKLNNAAFQQSFLIISAGIILALILFNYLLPRRSPPEYRPKTTSPAFVQLSQNSDEGTATPTPTMEFQTVTQVLAVQSKNCVYTEAYWRANPQVWLTDNIVVGQLTFSRLEGLTLLNRTMEDTSTLLQKQFLVTALNLLNGADPTPIEAALNEASQWINDHPPELEMPDPDRNQGILLIQKLTDYNQGLSGPVLCLDQPPTATITATRTPTTTPTPGININSSLPVTEATPTPDRDEQRVPSRETLATSVPTRTTAPTRQPTATQPPAAPQAPASTPTSAPPAPPEPTSTSQPPTIGSGEPTPPPEPAPPSPQPTDPPPEATQVSEPTSAPPPPPAPPPPEEPTDEPSGEAGDTEPPDIGDVLATLGVPLP